MSMIGYPALTLTLTVTGNIPAQRFVSPLNALPAAGGNTAGVTQNHGVDEPTAVSALGAVYVESGGLVTAGAAVETDADGCAIDHTTGAIVGRALSSADQAGLPVLVNLIPN